MNSESTNESSIAALIACPVVLMTASDEHDRHVMVTTVSYVSLAPLLLSTSVLTSSRTANQAISLGRLGISVAKFEQRELVEKIAVSSAQDKFKDAGLEPASFVSGVLYIADSLAAFDCSIQSATNCGANTLLLLAVNEAVTLSVGQPLLRYNRHYGRLMELSAGNDSYPI